MSDKKETLQDENVVKTDMNDTDSHSTDEREARMREFDSEINKEAADKQWESILGEEAAKVLSSDKRAVIDEALSIASNVLGHEAPTVGIQIEEAKVSEPVDAKPVSPVVQPIVNPMVGQPIVKTPEMAQTMPPKRNKPIRLIVTNDINEQTPIKPKAVDKVQPVKAEVAVAAPIVDVPVQAETAEPSAVPVEAAGVTEPSVAPIEEKVPESAATTEPVEEPVEAAETTEPVKAAVETTEPSAAPVEEVQTPVTADDMKLGELFSGTDIDAEYGNVPIKDIIEEKPRKKKVRTGVKVLLGTLIVLCILAIGGTIFVNSFLDRINYQPTISAQGNQDDSISLNNLDIDLVLKNEGVQGDGEDDMVVVDYDGDENLSFLLIGEEAIGEDDSGANGRSDSMMVLTVNTEKKTVKLISFMRDLYVNIPGYGYNRLNASYQLGGSELVGRTLNANFGIYVDGYVKVDFDGFSDIIDAIGGVEVTLTDEEALYLNTTNYISKKKYRTVVAGKQTLNGNQALGYCRVRKRACITGETDDYGRTARQRLVIEDIFKKVKKMRLFDMLGLAYDALPMITTDISKKDIISYVKLAASLNLKKIETSRIPVNGAFTGQEVKLGNVPAKVLVPDLEANKQALVEFLYGGEIPPDVQAHLDEEAAATSDPAVPAY